VAPLAGGECRVRAKAKVRVRWVRVRWVRVRVDANPEVVHSIR
jgi:hypothetical protein